MMFSQNKKKTKKNSFLSSVSNLGLRRVGINGPRYYGDSGKDQLLPMHVYSCTHSYLVRLSIP